MELYYVQVLQIPYIVFDEVYIINPPKKLYENDYVCDSKFHVDNIISMYQPENKIAVVLFSGEILYCYEICKTGSHIENNLLSSLKIELQKKQKKGGQSAQRIGRIREGKENDNIKRAAEICIKTYWKDNNTYFQYDGIILGGPAEMKNKLLEHPLFVQFFKSKLLNIVTTGEINKTTILTIEIPEIKNNKDIEEIKNLISQASEKICFGKKALKLYEEGSLEKILVDVSLKDSFNKNINQTQIIFCDLLKETQIHTIGIKWY